MKKILIICLLCGICVCVFVLSLIGKNGNFDKVKEDISNTKQVVIKKAIQNTNEYIIKKSITENQEVLNIISLLENIEYDGKSKQKNSMEIQPKYLISLLDSNNSEIVTFSMNSKELIMVGCCYIKINNTSRNKLYNMIEELSD